MIIQFFSGLAYYIIRTLFLWNENVIKQCLVSIRKKYSFDIDGDIFSRNMRYILIVGEYI